MTEQSISLERLEETGQLENTVICLSGDHYPYGLAQETIDELELSTYKKVFGRDIPVFAVRETIGEARAAAGAEQAAYAAKLLAGKLGSSAKAYIGGKAADVDVSGYKYVLAAAWGAGGSYSAVVLRKA